MIKTTPFEMVFIIRENMDFKEVPAGFGMALMQNEAATNAYAMMTREQKQKILAQARRVRNQAEMQSLVSKIALDHPQ